MLQLDVNSRVCTLVCHTVQRLDSTFNAMTAWLGNQRALEDPASGLMAVAFHQMALLPSSRALAMVWRESSHDPEHEGFRADVYPDGPWHPSGSQAKRKIWDETP